MSRILTIFALLIFAVLAIACRARAEAGEFEANHEPEIKAGAEADSAIGYDDWAATLERFVDKTGMVDYAGLRQGREALDRFVDQIGQVSPRSHPDRFGSEDEALAFYINAYNALVFAGVLDLDPGADSVWGITGTGAKFFARNKYRVGGEEVSLKKLEDEWIRAEFEDPRIHAALNCASMSCPRLPQKPFSADTLDEQLDAAMTEFVDEARNVEVSNDGKQVALSRIFDWFKDDFLAYEKAQDNSDLAVIDYVNRYRDESEQIPADAEVSIRDYDKRLNRQPDAT